ncbi:MAG: hypothetical protein AVDCRST_MAG42-980 [uncultured Chthoniobacterales bacterium]|uniref:N-acetyltransferase domain-containing protein n=1 Tax=uncultured Chthoniobacterales bacterium TaxID=1836801 RepID=A0A6J4HN38_9BACT|nr:MAG: hypothetical protein AVDCRST_MAG42-980 [uncultured Chthoniobacterales bacterium]
MSEREKQRIGSSEPQIELRSPVQPHEWEQYFDLRWRVLRAPWDQPRGSERDDHEAASSHLALWDQGGRPVAVGRIHLNSPVEAQVRYMAVEPQFARGGLGGRILVGLEARARELGAKRVVLNSRELACRFYQQHGYAVCGPAETMFGQIPHARMMKELS